MEDYIDLVIAKLDEDHIVRGRRGTPLEPVTPCMCVAMAITRRWK